MSGAGQHATCGSEFSTPTGASADEKRRSLWSRVACLTRGGFDLRGPRAVVVHFGGRERDRVVPSRGALVRRKWTCRASPSSRDDGGQCRWRRSSPSLTLREGSPKVDAPISLGRS